MNRLKTKAIMAAACWLILSIVPLVWAGPFSLETKLTGSTTAANDEFGTSVAIDGNTAIVGAWRNTPGAVSQSGAAYLFDVTTGLQTVLPLFANDVGSGGNFGVK